ncbi:MAG: oligosaccharide flippase family protein [bacterium]
MALNIVANFFGKFWLLAISILAVPVYIGLLGVEAFGLVGFFTVLLATLQLLEFGLGVVINREIAQTHSAPEAFQNTRDMVRSLEAVYWLLGLLLAGLVYGAAPFIATHWLNNEHQSTEQVVNALRLMGLIIAFQWPVSLYVGCLTGLERQVLLNLLYVVFGTLRTAGAIGVLYWVSPTLDAFFAWQLIAATVAVAGFAIVCWRVLPHRRRPARFSLTALRGVWRFAMGLGASGAVTFLLSNLDRLILSKFISLTAFGYYSVASQLNTAARMLPAAVFQALFPRFSALYVQEQGKTEELVALYHHGSQLISLLVFPAAMVLALFSTEILQLWLQNEEVARSVAMIASVLILGSALNAALGIPYEMTVARGWSMYGFYQNLVSSVVIVPLMLALVWTHGALGAAAAWLVLNIGYLAVAAPVMARRTVPRGELSRWYLQDVGLPLLVCAAVGAVMRLALPAHWPQLAQCAWIAAAWLLAQLACLLALPRMHRPARQMLQRRLWKLRGD